MTMSNDGVEREQHERRVREFVDIDRAKREARRRLDAEERGAVMPPTLTTLRERLARPRSAIAFRIESWLPSNSRVVFAAQFKTGKSTLIGNLARSLADGDAFLGKYPVAPVDGTIAILDFEMGGEQLDAWLRAQGIRNDDRILVTAMRGQGAAFNIIDPMIRARWVMIFQKLQVAFLILDCLRPILDALGLDEHRDVGGFLSALDSLLIEAGIRECCVVHHFGHTGERARGDSRLRDWPDCEWNMVRLNDDPASLRYIKAYGRDVDVPESQLLYDPATRALTIAAGSRKDAAARHAIAVVLGVLKVAAEPLNGFAIKKVLADDGYSKHIVDGALRLGVKMKALIVDEGPRNSKLYRLPGSAAPGSLIPSVSPVSPSLPAVSGNTELVTSVSLPPPFREGRLEHSEHSDTGEDEKPDRTRETRSPSFPSKPHFTKARRRPGRSRRRAGAKV